MRPCDVNVAGSIWWNVPAKHKNQWRSKQRRGTRDANTGAIAFVGWGKALKRVVVPNFLLRHVGRMGTEYPMQSPAGHGPGASGGWTSNVLAVIRFLIPMP